MKRGELDAGKLRTLRQSSPLGRILAAGLGKDPATLQAVVEPFLLQQGLLQRTPRGRVITAAGLAHLQAHPEPAAA